MARTLCARGTFCPRVTSRGTRARTRTRCKKCKMCSRESGTVHWTRFFFFFSFFIQVLILVENFKTRDNNNKSLLELLLVFYYYYYYFLISCTVTKMMFGFFPPSEPHHLVGSILFIQSDRCCFISEFLHSFSGTSTLLLLLTGRGTGGNLAAVHLHQCSSLHLQAFFPPRRRPFEAPGDISCSARSSAAAAAAAN